MMYKVSVQREHADLTRSTRVSRFVGYARAISALVCLGFAAFLWWLLASPRSAGKIFGLYSSQSFIVLMLASYILGWTIYYSINREPLPNKAANCGLTTITLVMLFGLFELPAILGWIDYNRVISPPPSVLFTMIKPWNNPANQMDRELVHIHRPRQKVVGETAGDLVSWLGISTDRRYKIDIEYDGNGFRNDHDIAQAPVLMIGDSFVEAGLVPQANLVSTRLSRLLQVEVANLGQSGYGPQQELVTLRRYGLNLQPKVVLWFFFEGNDLLDVPRYERAIQNWDDIIKVRDSLKDRSFINNALLALAGFTSPKLRTDTDEARRRSCKFLRSQSQEDSKLYFAYGGAPLSQQDTESLETAQACFLQAQRLCASAGGKLLFVHVPIKYRVYCDFCEFPDDGYGRTWQLNDLPSRLESWCKAQGIPYLDLTVSLKEAAASGELVYFSDDGHWNARGHEVVARAIANFLKASGELDNDKLKGLNIPASD
jgi:hypothetical protein